MRKIILAFLLLMTISVKSQEFNLNPDANNTNTDIDKFIGTWIWKNGNESLELVFRKVNIILPIGENVREDVLFGFHRYVKNGKEIESSLHYKDMKLSSNIKQNGNATLSGGKSYKSYQNSNFLTGGIKHLSKNKSVGFEIEYLDSKRIKLVKLENRHGLIVLKKGETFDSSISLPQDIILTKQ